MSFCCISQLIAITHKIYKAFDGNPSLETRGVFLDISKAFDKVWHEGLLYKLKSYGITGNFLKLLENYMSNRYQRVVLNGQSSSWLDVNAGVPQGSILGPLLFLIYINDLPERLKTDAKLFADDTSLFSTVIDIDKTSANLNNDLSVIREWAYLWKMSFNPDPNKQATEVIFSHKKKPVTHPILIFNNQIVKTAHSQKHLGLTLDGKLCFNTHLNEKISKANKGIGLIKYLHKNIPRKSLLTIYKSFIRPHLDYCDVIYDQPNNELFQQKLESVQYNATLAITGAIKGTSRIRLYQELGLESLSDRRWYRRLVKFYNIVKGSCPSYLNKFLPCKQRSYNTERSDQFRGFNANTNFFKNSFFPYCVCEWNKLDPSIRNSASISIFKNCLLKFIRPKGHSIYNIFDPTGVKLLTRLRVNPIPTGGGHNVPPLLVFF